MPTRLAPSGLCAIAGVAVAFAAPVLAGASEESTYGFLITKFSPAIHYGDFKVDCPQGYELNMEQMYLATQTPAEQARLQRPENAVEYKQKWQGFADGPNGEEICANPEAFLDDPAHQLYRTVQGPHAIGLNLDGTDDGRATESTRAHKKFLEPGGKWFVDNQLYRALGCTAHWRGAGPEGDQSIRYDSWLKDYNQIYLIQVRGVSSLENDDDVEVGFYTSKDQAAISGTGKFVADQTFYIEANPRWQAVTKGKIVNGVLTTEPVTELRLPWRVPIYDRIEQDNEYEFFRAKVRLELAKDGGLKGVMGAYQPIANAVWQARASGSGQSRGGRNRDCVSELKTLKALADGFPDPVTGEGTMISLAYNVEAVAAFVMPPKAPAALPNSSAKAAALPNSPR